MALQLKYNDAAVSLKAAASVTADTYGPVVDIQDYTGQGLVILNAAHDTGAASTLDVSVYTCDETGGTYTAVSGAAFAQVGTSDGHEAIGLDLRACERYIKLKFDIGGTGAGYTCAATAVFHDRGY